MHQKEILTRTYEKSNHNLESLHPILQKVFLGRGIKDISEVTHDKYKLLSYHSLKGVQDAASLIYKKIINQEKILIVGDYDADGATSTSLCIRFFKDINYSNIEYLIPNRVKDGYGLTAEIIQIAKEYNPSLIITVDNGISSIEGVKEAKKLNWNVIVTDHHLPGSTLPSADVIVNPNQKNCKFPSKNLAGVGVIFYVLCCLRAKLLEEDFFEQNKIIKPNMSRYLGLVALGTVADVVPLDQNNRTLVQLGLNNIRVGNCSYGILALCQVANRQPSNLVSSDFGFALAPRINAAGRLEDMDIGVKCLTEEDPDEALSYASLLNSLNEKRKVIENEMKQDALKVLDKMQIDFKSMPYAICLYNENWHEGVIGILASRIKDKYNRPTIVFTETPDENILKGSARSIQGINIKNILETMVAENQGMILKYGGHAMAAGLSINKNLLKNFENVFIQKIKNNVTRDMLKNTLLTDGAIEEEQIDINIARKIFYDIPWGQCFPEPSFKGIFNVVDCYVLGNKHLKFTLSVGDRMLKAVAFNVPNELHGDYVDQNIEVVYRITINNYYNQEEVQFIIEHIQT